MYNKKFSFGYWMGLGILLLVIFILGYGAYVRDRQYQAVRSYTHVIASSVWNFEPQAPKDYLTLIAGQQGYELLEIVTAEGISFVRITSASLSPLDTLLTNLHLIQRVRIESNIQYQGMNIGKITAIWLDKSIYAYFYALVLIVLALIIAWLYRHILQEKQLLEVRVQERTRELRHSEARFRRLAENAQDMIYRIVVPSGNYEYVSPAALELTGHAPEEFYQNATLFQRLIAPEWQAPFARRWSDILKSEPPQPLEYQITHRSGETRWIYHRDVLVYDDQGKFVAVEGIITDITMRRQAEAERAHLLERTTRMETELAVTRRLQQMILPSEQEIQAVAGLEIASFIQAAEEMGGDYYDVLPNTTGVQIGIGDVTGHGLESGVIMLMAQAIVRALVNNGDPDAARLMSVLNRTLYDNLKRMNVERGLTLMLLAYDAGKINLIGQHEPLIVIRKGGKIETHDTFDLGFPLGVVADIAQFLKEATIKLAPGDGIVLYSDGVTEAENTAGVLYGMERLCQAIGRHADESAEAIKDAIVADVRAFIGAQRLYDDLTLVVFKQK